MRLGRRWKGSSSKPLAGAPKGLKGQKSVIQANLRAALSAPVCLTSEKVGPSRRVSSPQSPETWRHNLPRSIFNRLHRRELGRYLIGKNGTHSSSSSNLTYWLTRSGTAPQCPQTAKVSSEEILVVFITSCKVLDFRLITLPIYQER